MGSRKKRDVASSTENKCCVKNFVSILFYKQLLKGEVIWLGTQEITWQWVPWIFFLLPLSQTRFQKKKKRKKENCSLKTPKGADKAAPRKACSPAIASGKGQPDRQETSRQQHHRKRAYPTHCNTVPLPPPCPPCPVESHCFLIFHTRVKFKMLSQE